MMTHDYLYHCLCIACLWFSFDFNRIDQDIIDFERIDLFIFAFTSVFDPSMVSD